MFYLWQQRKKQQLKKQQPKKLQKRNKPLKFSFIFYILLSIFRKNYSF
jgi:hypothetical protein